MEVLHGVSVADPYRWLEDPDSEETKAFVEAQNEVTNEVLESCESRKQLKELLTKAFDYPKFGTPWKQGDRYFYFHNSGLQQQYVLYTQASLAAEPTVVLDPNTLSADGTVALSDTSFSLDGKLMAYSTSSGGSDWCTIQVLRLEDDGSTTQLEDSLKDVKFSSLAWTHDGSGFFYNRYPKPKEGVDLGTETDSNTNQMLCFHLLGTPQEEDPVVLALPEHPTRMIGASVTDDGRYLILHVSEGCLPANMLWYVDLKTLPTTPSGAPDFTPYDFHKGSNPLPIVKLVDEFIASFSVIANDGTTFYIKTNLEAPRYRVVKTDVSEPGQASSWPDIVPQHPKDVLKSAVALQGDNLVLKYLSDVKSVLQLHRLTTGELVQPFPLPGPGTITSVSGSRHHPELFFSFQSFTDPGSTYHVPIISTLPVTPALLRRTQLNISHNPEDFVTQQVFVTSKDGTKVPMFIVHPKGLELQAEPPQPTLLYGYGGFNVSLEPSFSITRLAFMKAYGGVFALANLRGGGEYGTAWRDAGSCSNKQNVFDDFQACAEYLIKGGYSSPGKLIIQGGSNGGLLVAACANQRPDLYGCVLAQVGVMDMLRFHKFTIGHAWMTDYGNPDKEEDFSYIFPYSPLHNVRTPAGGSKQYPAMILATGDHDDRVVPLHSFKLISELQHSLAGSPDSPQRNPLLIRVEVRAGHGAGKPTDKVLQESADLLAFAAKCTGAKWALPDSKL